MTAHLATSLAGPIATSAPVAPVLATVTAGKVGVFCLVVLLGVCSGVLAALLGVGGAVVTTPAIRYLGATPIEAVGSTVPAILPGAVSGSVRYAREGLVEWRTALAMGSSGALLAVAGAVASDHVDGRFLMVLTAVLMLWSGLSVARGGVRPSPEPGATSPTAPVTTGPAPPTPPPSTTADGTDRRAAERPGAVVLRDVPRHPLGLLLAVGAAAGFVAGFLGVGGGIVMVPLLTGPLRFPVRAATASSLVAVAVFSLPALVTHTVLGHVNWFFAVPLMVGVVPGAQLGAHLTLRSSDRTIRLMFGAFLVLLAVVFAVTQVLSAG